MCTTPCGFTFRDKNNFADLTGLARIKMVTKVVDEIGFADLMPGSGHGQGGWSDVARVEVYGKQVKREGLTNQ